MFRDHAGGRRLKILGKDDIKILEPPTWGRGGAQIICNLLKILCLRRISEAETSSFEGDKISPYMHGNISFYITITKK